MIDIPKKALKTMKKVSVNLDDDTIKIADDLAKLTNSTRTLIIAVLIGKGIDPLIKNMETAWNSLLFAGNLDAKKKKKTELLLKELEKIKNRRKETWF